MANSFKSLFSRIIKKDEGQVSQPQDAHKKQIEDLENMEINLDNSNIKDDLDIDEIEKRQNKQNKNVETVILDFDDINQNSNEDKSKHLFETVRNEEKAINKGFESNNPSQPTKKARFLIVDDANFMRILLKKILEEEGFEVVGEASNGEEALQMVSQLSPDIVTMDITMPEMDGITALREITKNYPKVKVIMCSAINQREMVLEALKIGAKDFISKPFEQNKVADVIRRVAELE